MSNRFCNLNAPALIKDDFKNISTGFDKVQLEIDDIVLSDNNTKTSTIKSKTFTSVDDRIEETESDVKTDKENIAAIQEDVTGLLTSETNSKTSTIKDKTFGSVDDRIEETEVDVKTDKTNIIALQSQVTSLLQPATNYVSNGDMSTGTTGWTPAAGIVPTVVNQRLKVFGNNTAIDAYVSQAISKKAGKYYIACEYYDNDTTNVYTKQIQFNGTNLVWATTTINGRFNTIVDYDGVATAKILFSLRHATLAVPSTMYYELTNIVVLNLTNIFGAGKEPTKQAIEYLLAGKYINSYLGGTVDRLFTPGEIGRLMTTATIYATNLITNGNFISTTGWNNFNTSGVVSNNEYTATVTSAGYAGIYRPVSSVTGHKHYMAIEVYPKSANTFSIGFDNNRLTKPTIGNSWNRVSDTFVYSSSINATFYNSGCEIGDTIKFRRAIILDLTAIFGAGNEPSALTMDYLLLKYTNSWFDGTVLDLITVNDTYRNVMSGVTPVTNLIYGGNFTSTSGWTPVNSTLLASANTLTVTGTGTEVYGMTVYNTSLQSAVGKKIYIRAKVRVTNATCTSIILTVGGQSAGANQDYTIANPVINQWYTISSVMTQPSDVLGTVQLKLYHTYLSMVAATGMVMEVQYVSAIDLTATFGVGNEPSASAMDYLLSKYHNSWFDGTVTNLVEQNTAGKYAHGMLMPATNSISSTIGWSAAYSAMSITAGVVTLTGNGTGNRIRLTQQSLLPYTAGHKIYCKVKAKTTIVSAVNISITLTDSAGLNYLAGAVSLAPVVGQYYTPSSVVTPVVSSTNLRLYVDATGVDLAATNGKILEVQSAIMLDLTNIFGAGYEPTASEMDLMLTKFPNGWFDGTVNPLLTHIELANYFKKRLDLKADIAQPAWIAPTLINGWEAFDTAEYSKIKYFKDTLGFVHLHGLIKTGAPNTTAFVLPTGYRPMANDLFYFVSRSSVYALTGGNVASDGAVVPSAIAYTGYTILTGVVFKAEA